MIYLDLSSLNEQLHNECESTFQEEMEASDGTRCMLDTPQFNEIKLTKPSLEAQQVLCFFANLSCPISMMRFAASMFPYQSKKWPISSVELSQIYMLEAIEAVINLHYDKRAREMLVGFQSTNEFKGIMLVAHEIVDSVAVSENICTEVRDFIVENINLPTALLGRFFQ